MLDEVIEKKCNTVFSAKAIFTVWLRKSCKVWALKKLISIVTRQQQQGKLKKWLFALSKFFNEVKMDYVKLKMFLLGLWLNPCHTIEFAGLIILCAADKYVLFCGRSEVVLPNSQDNNNLSPACSVSMVWLQLYKLK